MRPRERLTARGAVSLSDDELLALIIGSGSAKRSALVIANELLRAIGGLRALGQADVARLRHHRIGLDPGGRSARSAPRASRAGAACHRTAVAQAAPDRGRADLRGQRVRHAGAYRRA